MIPEKLLAMILSNFAKDMGMSNYMALVTSSAFLKRTETSRQLINTFLISNCTSCALSPDECDYFNPKTANLDPIEVAQTNINLITLGKIKVCPQLRRNK